MNRKVLTKIEYGEIGLTINLNYPVIRNEALVEAPKLIEYDYDRLLIDSYFDLQGEFVGFHIWLSEQNYDLYFDDELEKLGRNF